MQAMEQATKELVQSTWAKRPLIISGPCSAETEEQVLQTAQRLAATGRVDMLRAGIWKPRTKPGMFEGVGVTGLPWLQQAKKLTGLPVTVEVGPLTVAAVDAALDAGLEIAHGLYKRGLVEDAYLYLNGRWRTLRPKESFDLRAKC